MVILIMSDYYVKKNLSKVTQMSLITHLNYSFVTIVCNLPYFSFIVCYVCKIVGILMLRQVDMILPYIRYDY